MVGRHIFDEGGLFTCDVDELADRLAELQSTLQVLTDRARGGDDLDMCFALGGASRLLFGIARDLVEIEEELRRRGAIADSHEYLQRQREHEEAHLREADAVMQSW